MRLGRTLLAAAAGMGGAYLGARLRAQLTPLDLRGKVAVVTGGSRGLGLLIARELAGEGCKVVIAARSQEELERARDVIRLQGSPVSCVVCDVGDKEQAENLVAEARRQFGGVDILVNNAGEIGVAPLEALTEAEFKRALDVMYWGVLHTTLAVLPHMRARGGGHVVNVTSFGGMVAVPHLLPYVGAKFAAHGFSMGLHAEAKKHGVMVTTVAPGTLRTGSHVQATFGGKAEQELTWFSLGASLPFFSVDAERAAIKIVRAIRTRAPLLVIGVPAKIGVRVAALFPGFTAEALAVVNRLLPDAPPAGQGRPLVKGRTLYHEDGFGAALRRLVTHLGLTAERRFQPPQPTRFNG